MRKQIFIRSLALLGMVACGYGLFATFSAMRHFHDVQSRLADWCAARSACVQASFDASLNMPVVRLQMKPARHPYRTDDLLADMQRAGVFDVREDLQALILKMPAVRLRLMAANG